MLGPSGFFMAAGPDEPFVSHSDMEIIHNAEAGFNILYRVSKNGRFFVYKALKPEYIGNPVYEQLLKKDFDIGFSMNHHGICQYYGFVNVPQAGNCIIMEWVDGCRLEDLVSEGRISKELARKIICEICDALDYMHRKQVIHRDLKPENILITYNGQNVKIIDFGLSDADSFNAFKGPAGTRMYASPELLAGESVDGRTDIWSLGLIIREMTSSYGHIVRRCLRRDKERRFASATEIKTAVLHAGRRRTGIFAVSLAIAVLLLLPLVRYAGKSTNQVAPPAPAVTSDTTKTEPELPDTEKAAVPVPSVDVKKEEPAHEEQAESIDSIALDALFNEAAGKI